MWKKKTYFYFWRNVRSLRATLFPKVTYSLPRERRSVTFMWLFFEWVTRWEYTPKRNHWKITKR